ncbi:TetR/AcrR family transcriptional regulator [Pseudomonas abietaniphila]|uniref:TetR/AcrR family transcriptional regulator n=1 Tax=Pseudomonas abietaniphila TaxID=89065 RepID=UPI003216B88A
MTKKIAPSSRPGRPREFDSDAVLDKAVLRFTEHGYHGSSISDLQIALGLTAGSIYKAWGDKRGLFLAALERYIEVRTRSIGDCLAGCLSARDKIQALMEQYVQLSIGKSGRSGCLVVETAVELAVSDAEIAERVAAQQKSREMQLKRLIEAAQIEGSVNSDLDSVSVARLMLAVQQGMRVLGKTGTSSKAMNSMVHELMRLLG